MARGGEFSAFITEFGSKEEEKKEKEDEEEEDAIEDTSEAAAKAKKAKEDKMKKAVAGAALMQSEERNTGAIAMQVYKDYMKAGHGEWVMPLLILSLVLMQGATVLSSYWYVLYLYFSFGKRSNSCVSLGLYGGKNSKFLSLRSPFSPVRLKPTFICL